VRGFRAQASTSARRFKFSRRAKDVIPFIRIEAQCSLAYNISREVTVGSPFPNTSQTSSFPQPNSVMSSQQRSSKKTPIKETDSEASDNDCVCDHINCANPSCPGRPSWVNDIKRVHAHLAQDTTGSCTDCKLSDEDRLAFTKLLEDWAGYRSSFYNEKIRSLHEQIENTFLTDKSDDNEGVTAGDEATTSGTATATEKTDKTKAIDLLRKLKKEEKRKANINALSRETRIHEEATRFLDLGSLCLVVTGPLMTMQADTHPENEKSMRRYFSSARGFLEGIRDGTEDPAAAKPANQGENATPVPVHDWVNCEACSRVLSITAHNGGYELYSGVRHIIKVTPKPSTLSYELQWFKDLELRSRDSSANVITPDSEFHDSYKKHEDDFKTYRGREDKILQIFTAMLASKLDCDEGRAYFQSVTDRLDSTDSFRNFIPRAEAFFATNKGTASSAGSET
jgi:hypothetical protein